jgi:hypothetical protein
MLAALNGHLQLLATQVLERSRPKLAVLAVGLQSQPEEL